MRDRERGRVNSERRERERESSGRSARLGAAVVQSHCTPMPRCAPPSSLGEQPYFCEYTAGLLEVFFIDNERK